MLEPLFNKVGDTQACDVIKQRPQQKCFIVNIWKFLRTSVLRNICEWLLLSFGELNEEHTGKGELLTHFM